MGKRLIDTEFFKQSFVKQLPAEYKLLWVYILNDCNHAGIWEVETDVAELRLGIKIIQDPKEVFSNEIVVFDNGRKWFIPYFIEVQYGELSPQNRVHNSVITILKSQNLEGSFKGRLSPVLGAIDIDIDKDKDIDNEKDNIQEEKKFLPLKTKKEKKEKDSAEKERPDFIAPSLQELIKIFEEKNENEIKAEFLKAQAEKMYNRCMDNGWKTGKPLKPIIDIRRTVRNWILNAVEFNPALKNIPMTSTELPLQLTKPTPRNN